jgi:hypothetical protein
VLRRILRYAGFASLAVLLLTLSAASGCKRTTTTTTAKPTPRNRHGKEITPLMTRVPTLKIPTPRPGVTLIPTLPG